MSPFVPTQTAPLPSLSSYTGMAPVPPDNPQDIRLVARRYLDLEQNQTYRAELEHILAENNVAELESRLRNPLVFGTAGLRATMGAGFSRMNDLTVVQASQGLALYLLQSFPDAKERGVVVGHDARHNSDRFARLTAGVFASKGIRVHFYETNVHTPLVAFGVRYLKAVAGVMVTASHNPKNDNGYKVYWHTGSQIIPPHDTHIAALIAANQEPWVWDETTFASKPNSSSEVKDKVEKAYFESVANAVKSLLPTKPTTHLRFTYTAMHGVATPFMQRAIQIIEASQSQDGPKRVDMVQVTQQCTPDPDFPTVKFPNPEEGEGALKLAMETADAHGIDLILANDPDGDRLAVAEKKPDGRWHIFTGDELGSMLGCYLLSQLPVPGGVKKAVLSSAVSSSFLSQVALKDHHIFEETLTGFKWLGHRALDHDTASSDPGHFCVFSYEEAIGFSVGGTGVYDKDGVSAGVAILLLRLHLAETGTSTSLLGYLDKIQEQYGRTATANGYVNCQDVVRIDEYFEKLRFQDRSARDTQSPWILSYPSHLFGRTVVRVRDLTLSYDSGQQGGTPTLPHGIAQVGGHMITFYLEHEEHSQPQLSSTQVRITLRTSGTEKKVKFYIEASSKGASVTASELGHAANTVRSLAVQSLQSVLNRAD